MRVKLAGRARAVHRAVALRLVGRVRMLAVVAAIGSSFLVAVPAASAFDAHSCPSQYGCIWSGSSFGGQRYQYKDSNADLGNGDFEDVSVLDNGSSANEYEICWYDAVNNDYYKEYWDTSTGNVGSFHANTFTGDEWEPNNTDCP